MVDLMRGERSVEREFNVGRQGRKLQHCGMYLCLCPCRRRGTLVSQTELGAREINEAEDDVYM